MKKIWVVLVICLWGMAAIQAFGIDRQEEKEKIMQVLADVGTMEQSASVEYYGRLKEKEDTPSVFLRRVAKELGMEEKLTMNQYTEEERRVAELSSRRGQDSLNVKMITVEENQGTGQYLLLSMKTEEQSLKVFEWRDELEGILNQNMQNVHCTTNLVGSYDGKLSLNERNRAVDELLEKMDVSVVEENRTMELYTIYGYTPLLKEYELQKGSPININLAMSYDELADKTYIYAAVPILNLDY